MRRRNDSISIEQCLEFEPLAKKCYTMKRKFRRPTKMEKAAIPNLLADSLGVTDGHGHLEYAWEELRISLRQTLLSMSQLKNAGYEAHIIADRIQMSDDDWRLLSTLAVRPRRFPASKPGDGKAGNRFEFAE